MLQSKKIMLVFFTYLTGIIQFGTILAGIQNVYWFIHQFVQKDISMYSHFFVLFFNTLNPSIEMQKLFSGLTVIIHLIIISMIFIIMGRIRKMIQSLKKGTYFTLFNLKNLKIMLICSATVILTQSLQLVLIYPQIAANNIVLSSIRRNDTVVLVLAEFTFLAILTVVFQVFSSSLNLKHENETFI